MTNQNPTKIITRSTALEVAGVKKSFGSIPVLRGVDLTLEAGERVALMGPSGSGKSTLLNCICGIEAFDRGEISIAGKPLSALSQRQLENLRRNSIGYVFQSFNLLPTLTAFENIEFPAQLAGVDRDERMDRVMHLLESVGLKKRAGHLPDALSGGERQRVALARALVHRPVLVLADEPTGSLDTENGRQVLELIESLSKEHRTSVLLVTHDHASTRICDRVISMIDGALVS